MLRYLSRTHFRLLLLSSFIGVICILLGIGSPLIYAQIIPRWQSNINIAVNLDVNLPIQNLPTIGNKFASVNAWYYLTHWDASATSQPAGILRKSHSYLTYVNLMTATGGCTILNDEQKPNGCDAPRDLLRDGNHPEKGLNFDTIDRVINNIRRQKLTPIIKLGNVPCAYTRECVASGKFFVNVRLPQDWDGYYQYIYAIARHMVNKYGVAEVKNWRWTVGTEVNNSDWFDDGNNQTTTKQKVFQLYDYSVAALQAAIGRENLQVGSHVVTEFGWNFSDFLRHCGRGRNFYTQGRGTQLDYLAFSSYKRGDSGKEAKLLRLSARINGLKNLTFPIDEGIAIIGADKKQLSGDTGDTYSAAMYGMAYQNMLNYGVEYWSRWNLSTHGVWEGVTTVGSNFATLADKLTADVRLPVRIWGKSSNPSNRVQAVAGYNPSDRTFHLLVFNYNPDPKSTSTEYPRILINLRNQSDRKITVKKWIIDDNHGQFWPEWERDATAAGINETAYTRFSQDSSGVQEALNDPQAQQVFNKNIPKYRQLAQLRSQINAVNLFGNSLRLQPELQHHGVILYEIGNVSV